MSRISVNLIDSLAIIQGETYRELIVNESIQIPGDWSTGTPRGQIRTDILANSGTLLADFLFEASVYDAESDTTTLKPYLTDEQTTAIAPTTYKTGRTPSVRNCYVADFEIELNGDVAKVAYGFVQVIGEVTGSGIPAPPQLMGILFRIVLKRFILRINFMAISNSRALEIIKNQLTALSGIASIPETHRAKLKELSVALTIDMVGDTLSPENALQMPAFIQLTGDGYRVHASSRNVANRIGQLSRGIGPIWSKVNAEGLSILLEICEVVDAIADNLAGED